MFLKIILQLINDGHYHGKWKSYHSNGNLKEKGAVVEGDQVGKWFFYDEDGNLQGAKTFEK